MYIHKHGIQHRLFFICEHCGCEYSADDKECFIFKDDGDRLDDSFEWKILCTCPDCGFENQWNANDILRASATSEEKK